MKFKHYSLLAAAMLVFMFAAAFTARAQTPQLVVICQSSWGSSSPAHGKLGGCSAYVDATKPAIYFGVPDANSLVYTDASDQWTKCGTLKSTANLYTATNKNQWDDASSATGLTKVAVGTLCGSTPAPTPAPIPSPPSPPTLGTCNTDACVFNWTASATDTDNKPEKDTGYILTIDGKDTTLPAVLTYTVTGLSVGNHVATLRAIDASGTSDYTTPNPFTVIATTPAPSVTEQLGTWTLTAVIQTGLADYAACKALAVSKAKATYICTVSNSVTVK